ncbi:cupredoxin domain-containing protein [Natronorubrum halophilum]|uniref:cupredoxin domain-containing protein n=1 Tax=Natronorubrum halophilum TaxID=1702106 RepID=UPI000EF67F16|nr:plastocyanin/azurin family copper-binding protein [Natronorubrum halophilum]
MPNGPARRQLLKAVVASSIVAPVAGCIGTLETDGDETTDPSDEDEPGDSSTSDEPARDVGRSMIAALGDGDFETAASYYPVEQFEDEALDEADIAEELENGWPTDLEWIDADVDDVTCECVEPYPDDARAGFEADITGTVATAVELRFSVAYGDGGETVTESAFVNGVEIDGDWYGLLSPRGGPELCGDGETTDGRDEGSGDDGDEREQALEPAAWEDVDEIVLEGAAANWVGVEPAPIEEVENPTLLLFEGREYAIEWRNGDGLTHNLQIRDEADDGLAETDFTENEGDVVSVSVEATATMDRYVCEPHKQTMVGSIDVRDA